MKNKKQKIVSQKIGEDLMFLVHRGGKYGL